MVTDDRDPDVRRGIVLVDLRIVDSARPAWTRLIRQPFQPVGGESVPPCRHQHSTPATTCPFAPPSAHASAIRDRVANACAALRRRTQPSNTPIPRQKARSAQGADQSAPGCDLHKN